MTILSVRTFWMTPKPTTDGSQPSRALQRKRFATKQYTPKRGALEGDGSYGKYVYMDYMNIGDVGVSPAFPCIVLLLYYLFEQCLFYFTFVCFMKIKFVKLIVGGAMSVKPVCLLGVVGSCV